MGFLDKLTNVAKNFDYEGAVSSFGSAMEKKQASIEKRAHNEYREKARTISDEALMLNLERARDDNNYIMVEEIEREMDRRGLYY